VDGLDVDRYLPPRSQEKGSPAATPGAAAALLPVDLLKALSLEGRLSAGRVKAANLRLGDITLQVVAGKGTVTLHPLSASLYGGRYTGNVVVDASGDAPVLRIDERIAGVRLGDLLSDLQGRAQVTGIAEAALQLQAAGAGTDAMIRSMDGTVSTVLREGSIEGVDILARICRSLGTAGSGQPADLVTGLLGALTGDRSRASEGREGAAERTSFSELKGTLVFEDGVGVNEDLRLYSPLLRVEGSGRVHLPERRLDYNAVAALVKSCEGQGGQPFRELANVPIPLRIFGPFDDLKIRPDITAGILEILRRREASQGRPASETPLSSGGPPGPPTPSAQKPEKGQKTRPIEKPRPEDALEQIFRKGLQDLLKKP
jgi:AsmA protein